MPRIVGSLLDALRAVPAEAWVLGVSLNGFFVYLAILDVADVEPRTWLTALYYFLLGALMATLAWRQREVLRLRLTSPDRIFLLYALLTAFLTVWFLANVALLSEGSLPRRLAAMLVLWTLPTTLLLASLRRPLFEHLARALVVLGLLFTAAEILALFRIAGDEVKRFSPVAALDPITAGQTAALGAVACLALRPTSRNGRVLQGAALALLTAGAVPSGSRAPLLGLGLGAAAFLVFTRFAAWRTILPGLAAGLALGFSVASLIGSSYYLTYSTPGFGSGSSEAGDPEKPIPISTLSIRRQWWESAIRDTPDRPLFGHGVAMFVDDTPEGHRMGIAGRRTYPHNSLIEAGYSLGLLGLVPYVLLLALVAWSLVRLHRRGQPDSDALFVLTLVLFAFVASSLSGEIGSDALLWSAGALAVGLYAEERRRASSR